MKTHMLLMENEPGTTIFDLAPQLACWSKCLDEVTGSKLILLNILMSTACNMYLLYFLGALFNFFTLQ